MAHSGIYRDIYELQLRPQEEVLLDAAIPAGGDGGEQLMRGMGGGFGRHDGRYARPAIGRHELSHHGQPER